MIVDLIITNITDGLHIDIFWTMLMDESTDTTLLTEKWEIIAIIKYFEILLKKIEINALKLGATSNTMDELRTCFQKMKDWKSYECFWEYFDRGILGIK